LFRPGQDFDELIAHSKAGDLLGILALWFTESSVCSLPADLRAALGTVLRLALSIYVPDKLGANGDGNGKWCLHYGVNAKLGGHPAWFGDSSVVARRAANGPARSVASIIASALNGDRFAINPPAHPTGSANNVVYSEVRRFVEQVGLVAHMQYMAIVDPATIEREKTRAIETIKAMLAVRAGIVVPRMATDDEHTALASLIGGIWSKAGLVIDAQDEGLTAPVAAAGKPRELVLGTVFDPTTHYTDEYYGGGAGLLYTRPDGTKDIYHGTAHDWDGFRPAAQFLRALLPATYERLADLGCGSGAFVSNCMASGFNAWGLDISEAAVARAQPNVRGRLAVRDITEGAPPAEPFDVVTALDVWEHIFAPDIDALMKGVYGLLADGGIGFFIICTRAAAEQDWTIKRGAVFEKSQSWLLASGHVTIRKWGWWRNRFEEAGFHVRSDLAHMFQVLRDEEPGLREAESWRPKNLVVVQKP
jgi:SAM-dependent methyltransferase